MRGLPIPIFSNGKSPCVSCGIRYVWPSKSFWEPCERSLIRQVSVVQDDGEEGTMDVQAAVVVDEAQLSEFI